MKNFKDIFLIKFMAIITVYLLVLIDEYSFIVLTLGAAIAHFLQGAYYGRTLLRGSISHNSGRLALAVLFFAWMLLFFNSPWTVAFLLFLPHYGFTEAYLGVDDSVASKVSPLLFLRVIFEGLVYVLISKRIGWVLGNETIWFSVFFAITGLYVLALAWNRRELSQKLFLNMGSTFLLSLGMVWAHYEVFKFSDPRGAFCAVLIHGFIWIYYPLYKDNFRWTENVRNKLGGITITSIICVSIFFVLNRVYKWTPGELHEIFVFFLYFHIFSSLASSRENPRFIYDFFHPKKALASD